MVLIWTFIESEFCCQWNASDNCALIWSSQLGHDKSSWSWNEWKLHSRIWCHRHGSQWLIDHASRSASYAWISISLLLALANITSDLPWSLGYELWEVPCPHVHVSFESARGTHFPVHLHPWASLNRLNQNQQPFHLPLVPCSRSTSCRYGGSQAHFPSQCWTLSWSASACDLACTYARPGSRSSCEVWSSHPCR